MSNLREKVFSGGPVKCFFLYGSNNWDSVVFGNASCAEIKYHSSIATPFQKNFFTIKVLDMCLPYAKKYFQEHHWSDFFFMAQITEILFCFRMPVLKRSQLENDSFSKKKKLLWKFYVCVYLTQKGIFRSTSEVCFSLWFKELRFCCFQECWFCRDQRSQFEKDTFSKNFLQ